MNTLLFQQQIKRRKKKPGKRSRKRVFSLKLNPMIFTVYLPLSIAFGFFILFAGVYNSQLATDPVSETGSGVLPVSRENDIEYTIQKHDTIYQIAYTHGVDPMELAEYNNIANPSFIKPGQMILIPSTGHLDDRRVQVLTAAAGTDQSTPASTINATDNSRSIPKPVSSPSLLPAKILIGSEQQSDGLSVTAKFFLETKIDVKAGATYIWDFGDGLKAYQPTASHTYSKPGTYTVLCTLVDKTGARRVSNKIHIDIPQSGTTTTANITFRTIKKPGDTFEVEGEILQVNGQADAVQSAFDLVSESEDSYVYQALKPGYFIIRTGTPENSTTIDVFVSPVESVHSDRTDMNWYRTQFNTGTPSNCGPATVSMGISWAKGTYVAVSTIRANIGWHGDGATSFAQLAGELTRYGVKNSSTEIKSSNDLRTIIDRDHIAIVLIHCGRISGNKTTNPENFFGRYYSDSVGHYIVIKGYSADGKYFIAYDPLPGDWISNSSRYSDGISMLGRNRYYLSDDIARSLTTMHVIEISR